MIGEGQNISEGEVLSEYKQLERERKESEMIIEISRNKYADEMKNGLGEEIRSVMENATKTVERESFFKRILKGRKNRK